MEPWTQALIDFGILWAGSSCVTLCGIFATGKLGTPLAMLGTSATNGAIGAGAGIGVLDKLGIRAAMALAAFVGAGLLSKEFIVAVIKKKLGIHDERDQNQPPS